MAAAMLAAPALVLPLGCGAGGWISIGAADVSAGCRALCQCRVRAEKEGGPVWPDGANGIKSTEPCAASGSCAGLSATPSPSMSR